MNIDIQENQSIVLQEQDYVNIMNVKDRLGKWKRIILFFLETEPKRRTSIPRLSGREKKMNETNS